MRRKVKSHFKKSKEEKEGKEKVLVLRWKVSISVHACMPPPSSQPIRQCQTSYMQHQYVFKHFQNGDFAMARSMKKDTTTFPMLRQ
uniref:Uncharacterized protein n=1 Tax=Vespula pensylvanica TaxID=30213 RepID=A0A834PB10_VESPE|nr:hypothetical protein H0235_002982 [Vespula pensylvanica]